MKIGEIAQMCMRGARHLDDARESHNMVSRVLTVELFFKRGTTNAVRKNVTAILQKSCEHMVSGGWTAVVREAE